MNKHTVKSCCGSSVTIFEPPLPIRKFQIHIFKDAGYEVLDTMFNAGIFYVRKGPVIATGSFGANKINVRVSDQDNNAQAIIDFEKLLEQAVSLKK